MKPTDASGLTENLQRAQDPEVRDRVLAEVYDQLLRLARLELSKHQRGGTLDTRVLVNEAYIKLFGGASKFISREHFFNTAAQAMRQIVIDFARARVAERRGAGCEHVQLDQLGDAPLAVDSEAEHLLAIDAAMQELATLDSRLAQILELRFFAGLEVETLADLLGVSVPTIVRDTRTARAFLEDRLRA